MSSSPNLQNISKHPVNIRKMVRPPQGRVFVGADYSALELRILAVFAGARNLLQLFRSNADTHSWMAEQVFGNAFKNADPKTRKALRDLTKRVVYGMQYGAGALKVFTVLTEDKRVDAVTRSLLSQKLVGRIMKTFLEVNPEGRGFRRRFHSLQEFRTTEWDIVFAAAMAAVVVVMAGLELSGR